MGHEFVGTGHLLLAIIADPDWGDRDRRGDTPEQEARPVAVAGRGVSES